MGFHWEALSGWVMPSRVERIAPTDSPNAEYGSLDCAVLLDGQYEILTARGRESAVAPQQRPQEDLITAHRRNQQPARQTHDCSPEGFHFLFCLAILSANRLASLGNAPETSLKSGSAPRRGRTTRSYPAGSLTRDLRNASRISRFQRLRTTAGPTLRDTDKPSRVCGKPFMQARTTST